MDFDVLHSEVTINLPDEGKALEAISSAVVFSWLRSCVGSTIVVVRVSVIIHREAKRSVMSRESECERQGEGDLGK